MDSVVSNCLRLYRLWPARLLCPWNFPGKNAGVGCHSLLQRITLTQGLNPCLLHCRHILLPLSHWRSPNRQVLNSININRKVPVYSYTYAYVDRHLAFLGKLYLEVYLNTLSAIVPEMELVWSLCFVCECVSACSRKSNPSQSLTLLQECFQCLSWAASVSQPLFYPTPMPWKHSKTDFCFDWIFVISGSKNSEAVFQWKCKMRITCFSGFLGYWII